MEVDLEVALARLGGDENLLKEIAALFLREYPETVAGIRRAIDDGDAQALEQTAHSLKGSVSNFGARGAYAAALKLEMLGRQAVLAEARETLAELEHALERLKPYLLRLICA